MTNEQKLEIVKPPLLLTINCSIGDKNRHLSVEGLCDLLLHIKDKENHLTQIERYAITMIKEEALPQEIEWFKQRYNIPQENIDYALSIKPYKK